MLFILSFLNLFDIKIKGFDIWKERPIKNVIETKSKWTWNFVGPEGGEVIRIIANPSVPNWCYGISVFDLWVSYDNGNTWSYDPYFSYRINGMEGGDGIIITDMTGIIVTNDTIYRTTDKGATWVPIKGFNTLLAISSETPDTIIYAADMNYPYFRVWRSNDKGLTWNLRGNITPIIIDNCDLSFIAHRKDNPNYVRTLIECNDTLVIIVGSTDGGMTWSIYDTILGEEARDFQIDPYNTNHSFITTTNGLFEATSFTGPWNKVLTAMLDTLAQPFDVEFLSSSEIIVSSYYNQGIFKGVQMFTVWYFQRIEKREVSLGIGKSGNYYFCGTLGLGILRSLNGTNWEFVNNGLTAHTIFSRGNVSSLHDSSFYFTDFGGILRRTKNYGQSWEILKNITLFGGSVEYSPNDPNFILFSGFDIIGGDQHGPIFNSVFRSLDGGYFWVPIDSTYILGDIHIPYKDSIVIGITTTVLGDECRILRSNKKGEGLIPVFTPPNALDNNMNGLDSVFFVTSDESTYISMNYGETWQNANGSGALSYDRTRRIFYIGSYTDTLIRYNVKTMHIDKIAPNIGYILDHSVSPNGILYVLFYLPGGISAIGKSVDSAETFVIDTLPFYGGNLVKAGDSAVFIYQLCKGFYVSKDITTSIPEERMDFVNIKNLFGDEIYIKLSLKVSDIVNIDIYDITGRKVKELIKDKVFEVGNYELKYNLEISKGIYFVKVKTKRFENLYKFIKF